MQLQSATRKHLIIRCDASESVGSGHLMRMIALAQEWQRNEGAVVFLCAEIAPAFEKRILNENFGIEILSAAPGSSNDREATSAWISRYAKSEYSLTVALDGYQFDDEFQLAVKKTGARLLAVDDYGHAAFYYADWVLNQNISANEMLYSQRLPETQLLLGTQFVLLRREFLQYCKWKRPISNIGRKVLVTLGGSDSENITQKIIEVLASLKLEVRVVVGGGNPNLKTLTLAISRARNSVADIRLNVNPPDMPAMMAWADFAISAGGTTVWELAFMGLPSFLLVTAENQREMTLDLIKQKQFLQIEMPEFLAPLPLKKKIMRIASDHLTRKKLSNQSSHIVDGMGASRVCCILKK
jgi:UDP-2,4-diacetamido-2,4,6-trideoxy-beta-L-altropyranose hydrolase